MTEAVGTSTLRRASSELSLGSPVRGVIRLAAYLALTALMIPLQSLVLALRPKAYDRIPMLYHRVCCRIFGFRVETLGTMSQTRPTLFVCNHCSYIDIPVLGTLMPVSFVAKSEVAGWPFFGLLAKLQRTVFVDRKRNSTKGQAGAIERRLAAGDNLMLFPEGTSADGNRLKPFFSALFAVAERRDADGRPLVVQPVSLAYTELDGAPLGYGLRPLVAWYGDMNLVAHLWRLVCLGHITAKVRFHEPVTLDAFGSRKTLSQHCERQVAAGLSAALAGRTDASAS
jgi:1-acyl-sn-glycerol-3-phosphate acyltransferase